MTLKRPDPDALLQAMNEDAADQQRAKLKIFFGYAAGVGKTYAMLQAAQQAKACGREIVVGYVEPHGRKETEALLNGLEVLPTREVNHHHVSLREFDVDAALIRHPSILLVDELAHTNAEGSRHSKRWQDVMELLDSGIHVWTTLNVQHIESLNDVVGSITGVTVRETIPDHVFDRADDLELVDITHEELLDRLKEGKVYVPNQAQRALENFFKKSNLIALRELSLRQTTQRVHSDVESVRKELTTDKSWTVSDTILVCIGPSPTTARVIRTAKRMATALDCPWYAVAVERTGIESHKKASNFIVENMRLAERLGANTATLTGSNVAATVLDFARNSHVTKILVGKTRQPKWHRIVYGNVVDQLLDQGADFDIYIIQGKADEVTRRASTVASTHPIPSSHYLAASAIVAIAFGIATILYRLGMTESNIVMTLLVGVAWVAFQFGRIPSIAACFVSVLLFDIAFVPPVGSFTITDSQYLITFFIMLLIGLLISAQANQLRSQLELGQRRERRLLSLNRLSKQLAAISGDEFLVIAVGKHLQETFGNEIAIYINPSGSKDMPILAFGQSTHIAAHPVSALTAHWVANHDQAAGKGTDTLPNAIALFIPITGSQSTLGAIAIDCEQAETLLQSEQRQWIESCANQLALALERDRLSVVASEAKLRSEAERIRSTLLSGVSHDLKTPLAVIAGASSALIQYHSPQAENGMELLQAIYDESTHLNSMIDNVLQISRIETGTIHPRLQWHFLDEIVGAAISRMQPILKDHTIQVCIPQTLPLVKIDALLIEQVLQNLLENAAKYTPSGSKIVITAHLDHQELIVTISDNGPGIPTGKETQIFDRYFRSSNGKDSGRGSGLGLAVCKAIIELHEGVIRAKNLLGGGAEFEFRLPCREQPPQVILDEENPPL